MQDQRLINRLQNYWELIRRGKPMPEINHFNSATVEDLWERCIQFEVIPAQGGSVSFRYKYMGAKLLPVFGADLTGNVVDHKMVQYPYAVIVKKLAELMQSTNLIIDQNQFVSGHGKIIKYRACFMPFGNEARGITHIIVGLSDKQFS